MGQMGVTTRGAASWCPRCSLLVTGLTAFAVLSLMSLMSLLAITGEWEMDLKSSDPLVRSPRARVHGYPSFQLLRNLTLVSARHKIERGRLAEIRTYLAAHGHRLMECDTDDPVCLALADMRIMTFNGPRYFNKHACSCGPRSFCLGSGNSQLARRWFPFSRALARTNAFTPSLFLVDSRLGHVNNVGVECTGRIIKNWIDARNDADLVLPPLLAMQEAAEAWRDGEGYLKARRTRHGLYVKDMHNNCPRKSAPTPPPSLGHPTPSLLFSLSHKRGCSKAAPC